MLLKKIIGLGVIGLSVITATTVMAGGVDQTEAPLFQPSVYVDLHVGYAQVNWKDFNASGVMGVLGTSYFAPNSNGLGGVTGGADVGYQFSHYLAGEGGWFYIPEVKGDATTNGIGAGLTSGQTAKVHSWLAYLAAKLSVPMVEHVSLYGKVGVAYRSLTYTKPTSAISNLNALSKDGGYWTPVFAAGMQYTRDNWLLGVQYLHLPGNTDHNGSVAFGTFSNGGPDAAPDVNLYTAYVGYQYSA